MAGIRRLVLPFVVVLLLVGAAPAQATLEVRSNSTEGLVVIDKNGISDFVSIIASTRQGDPVYLITSTNPTDFFKYDFKQGCSQGNSGNEAICQRLSGKLNLAMDGGSDNLDVDQAGATSASVNLGSGDDTYRGLTQGADDVFAAGGKEDIRTFAGNDEIRFSDDGTDEVRSGTGNDSITENLFEQVSFGEDFIDSGEGDDVIEVRALVTEARGRVFAGAGTDTVTVLSGAGDIRVTGDSGDDTLTTRSGDDSVTGGPDDDDVKTGNGDDVVDGGRGEDNISTGGGDDEITSKEAFDPSNKDTVHCGFDDDEVIADLMDEVDVISAKRGGTCEEVDDSPVGETPHVRILGKTLTAARSGRVRVRMRCPRRVRKLGCKGRLQLGLDPNSHSRGARASRSRKVRYRIRAGRRKTVRLKLSRSDVRRLRKRQRRGRETRGILVSVEKGRKGPKTTIRNPRLKLRR